MTVRRKVAVLISGRGSNMQSLVRAAAGEVADERELGGPEMHAARTGLVAYLAEDGIFDRVRFSLKGCLPVKLKAPALNAKDGQVAVEEMQVAYECLSRIVEGGSAS